VAELIRIYTENNDFQYLETLGRNRSKRHQTQTFLVEGVNAINQALANQWQIEAYAFVNDQRLSDWATSLIGQSTAQKHYSLPGALMQKISQKDNPSELIAIPHIPADDLARIPANANPLIVILDRIASPGNLGTIIRSCEALGVDGIIVTGHAVDLYAPETIRATTGSFFAIPVIRLTSSKELMPWLQKLKKKYPRLTLVGTSAKAKLHLYAHNFKTPTVLLIGNENHGLSVHYREMCDAHITIPMVGSASSMNVACATSILLYEINRQRA
jgi:TrmH family RNA methyltransferase